MKRIPLIIATIAVAMLVVIAGCSWPKHGAPQKNVVAPLTEQDLARIGAALSSHDPAAQATALLPDLAVLTQDQSLLPDGATLTMLPATKTCKDSSCKVDAMVTQADGTKVTYVLYLDYSANKWLIAATDKKE